MEESTNKQEKKAKKGKAKIIIPIIIVAVIAAIGTGIAVTIKNAMNEVSKYNNMVSVQEVGYQNLSESISISGTVKGISQTNVSTKASAEVTSVSVLVGDQVKKGDILCVLDSTEIQKQIDELKKSISNQEAIDKINKDKENQSLKEAEEDRKTQLAEAQKSVDKATNDYNSANATLANDKAALEETNNQLYALSPESETYEADYAALSEKKAGLEAAVSLDEKTVAECKELLDAANSTYSATKTSADRMVDAAKQSIELSKYTSSDDKSGEELTKLEEMLADCIVYAPCDGVLTAVNVSVGDNTSAGVTLFTIEDTSKLKINATVDEGDILKINEGLNAVVTTTATGDKEFSGTVTRVVKVKDSSTTEMGGSSGYAAEITIDKSELLVGMSAKVRIILVDRPDVLSVAYDAVQYDDDGQAYVLCAEELNDGSGMSTAVRKNITVGDEINYFTEVLGGDLVEGDKVISDLSISEGDTFMVGDYSSLFMEEE